MLTTAMVKVQNAIEREFGVLPTSGDFYCRPKRINGKLQPGNYSEHAWGNATDYSLNGYNQQVKLVTWLQLQKAKGLPVGTVLWAGNRPSDHSDHVHVEGSPKQNPGSDKIPPCAGGKGGEVTSGKDGFNLGDAVASVSPAAALAGIFTGKGDMDDIEEAISNVGFRIGMGLLALVTLGGAIALISSGAAQRITAIIPVSKAGEALKAAAKA